MPPAQDRPQVRCESCGHVDVPTRVSPGPGWLAFVIWSIGALLLLAGFFLAALRYAAWAVLLAGALYTIWFFWRRREACRHCGSVLVGPPPRDGG